MSYVDGFVIPISKKNVVAYKRMAQLGSKIWREHGALEYRECIGDDLEVKMGLPFPRAIKLKRGETVIFSWIVYKSRAHRDRVNAKVMKDPRLANMAPKIDAVRHEAHDLWRIQSAGRGLRVTRGPAGGNRRRRAVCKCRLSAATCWLISRNRTDNPRTNPTAISGCSSMASSRSLTETRNAATSVMARTRNPMLALVNQIAEAAPWR